MHLVDAAMQSPPVTDGRVDTPELMLVLALVRGGTLARASALLGVDSSTAFRALQRLERRLQRSLFERSRRGYRASELALQWAAHAEQIEAQLEAASAAAAAHSGGTVSGRVRITTTDTLLEGLLMPALPALAARHPALSFELNASNELASLTRRDADIALRATQKPPDHLVGRHLGPVRAAVYAKRPAGAVLPPPPPLAACPWVAPDEALPDHPSVRWRRKQLPRVLPQFSVNSILAVAQAVRAGLGVGILPMFLAERHPELVPLTAALPECETQLWLLTHPESRHLRRIAVVAEFFAQAIRLA
jgi:DNA-binding transcriptional LysR family regulator